MQVRRPVYLRWIEINVDSRIRLLLLSNQVELNILNGAGENMAVVRVGFLWSEVNP